MDAATRQEMEARHEQKERDMETVRVGRTAKETLKNDAVAKAFRINWMANFQALMTLPDADIASIIEARRNMICLHNLQVTLMGMANEAEAIYRKLYLDPLNMESDMDDDLFGGLDFQEHSSEDLDEELLQELSAGETEDQGDQL